MRIRNDLRGNVFMVDYVARTKYERSKTKSCYDLPWFGRNGEVKIIRKGK